MVLMGFCSWVVETHDRVRNSKKMEEYKGGLVLNPLMVVCNRISLEANGSLLASDLKMVASTK